MTHQKEHKKTSSIFSEEVHRNKWIFVISTIIFSLLWQISFENLQSSPQYVLKGKAETINNGLQAIEKMLEQKTESVAKAKEVQKVILPFFFFFWWALKDFWLLLQNPVYQEYKAVSIHSVSLIEEVQASIYVLNIYLLFLTGKCFYSCESCWQMQCSVLVVSVQKALQFHMLNMKKK